MGRVIIVEVFSGWRVLWVVVALWAFTILSCGVFLSRGELQWLDGFFQVQSGIG